ncbi:MAG: hypothetical protein ABIJ39_01265 [Chloroflexota bacterium]
MNHWGRVLLAFWILAVAILIGVLVLMKNAPIDAVIAFLGVLLGGLITGYVQYSISEANRKQQLRLAALDKRLQTAQDAFALWLQLRRLPRADDEQTTKLVLKALDDCRQWWETHSLFLTKEAREAFKDAFRASEDLVVERARKASWKEMENLHNKIERAGMFIEASVLLPPIGRLDSNKLDRKPDKSDP